MGGRTRRWARLVNTKGKTMQSIQNEQRKAARAHPQMICPKGGVHCYHVLVCAFQHFLPLEWNLDPQTEAALLRALLVFGKQSTC
jgi:hypothetical protein